MKIIINADDFGFTQGSNDAVFELAQSGTLTSTTVMANMPYAAEASKLMDLPSFSVGLHFNLTQGTPVLPPQEVPTLVDPEGKFNDLATLRDRAGKGKVKASEIEAELTAQRNVLREIIGDRISHFDSHQGLNRIPFIFKFMVGYLKENPVKATRVYVKYYGSGQGESACIKKPGFGTLKEFGLKRTFVEKYLERRRAELRKVTRCPDGMLVTGSHQTIDVLRWLVVNKPRQNMFAGIVEIPCHPATTTKGLVDTKYTDERVQEYEFLKSTEFQEASKRWQFVDYSMVG